MKSSLVLMGPDRAGKRTVGKLLAEQLGRPFHEVPDLHRELFKAMGFDEDAMRRAWEEGGFESWYRYIQPFQPYVLERELAEHAGAVVTLAALLMVPEEPGRRSKVPELLAPHTTVLLLPSPDVDESVRILQSRQRIVFNGMDANEYFVRHPSNELLAKQRVYTRDQSPAETRDEVLDRLDRAQQTIILIGPMGTGKSTIGRLLAERLAIPQASLDEHRWRYYDEIGFSREEMMRRADEEGPHGVLTYWKQFEAHAVDRVLSEYPDHIIDFGAGHSVYDDETDFERVRQRLAPYTNVVLLLPSPDPDESVRILEERNTRRIDGVEINRFLITHPVAHELARLTVYTEGRTPAETRDEILGLLDRDASPVGR
jgi:shikimate kinase